MGASVCIRGADPLGRIAAVASQIRPCHKPIPTAIQNKNPPPRFSNHWATRQGERSVHVFSAAVAHAVDLSAWQTLQAFGIVIPLHPGVETPKEIKRIEQIKP